MHRPFVSFAFAIALGLTLASPTRAAGPVAAAPPASAPVPVPTATSSSSPTPGVPYDRFVATDLLLATQTANARAPRITGTTTQDLRAGLEYRFLGRNFIAFEYRRFRYAHPANDPTRVAGTACSNVPGDPGCVTQIGGTTTAYEPRGLASEQQIEFHTSLVGRGHAYLATSTFGRFGNDGYPRLRSDFGFGAELLPALERPFALSGAFYYYPDVHGTFARADGTRARLRYKLETFDLRAHAAIAATPFFLEIGFYGDRYLRKENAPSDASHRAFDLGFGLHV